MLQLSWEDYVGMENLTHFNDIVSLAALNGISYYQAETLLYIQIEQNRVESEPTGQVYTENPGAGFFKVRHTKKKFWNEAD